MSLASTLADEGAQARRPGIRLQGIALDAVLLTGLLALANAFLFNGGLEALISAAAGAMLGARRAGWKNARLPAAISGAFVGFFAGALFAGFFQGAFVSALSAVM